MSLLYNSPPSFWNVYTMDLGSTWCKLEAMWFVEHMWFHQTSSMQSVSHSSAHQSSSQLRSAIGYYAYFPSRGVWHSRRTKRNGITPHRRLGIAPIQILLSMNTPVHLQPLLHASWGIEAAVGRERRRRKRRNKECSIPLPLHFTATEKRFTHTPVVELRYHCVNACDGKIDSGNISGKRGREWSEISPGSGLKSILSYTEAVNRNRY